MPTPENLHVAVEDLEPLTGGESNLQVPVEVAEPLTGGEPDLRTAVETAEPLTGGQPRLRVAVEDLEPLTGGEAPKLRVAVMTLDVLGALPPEPFMATLVFPTLRGRSWSTVKKPTFSTRTDAAQSGQEVRSASYPFPRWEFDLTFQYLPEDTDLRTLLGFFLQCQGSFADFLFSDCHPGDPSAGDYQVRGGQIGVGDAVTVQWPLVRDLGGFVEPVGQIDLSTLFTFPASAVDSTTGLFTIPDHGLASGDGPYFVTSTGTLPGGLTPTEPWWVIAIDPNTIQLATTAPRAVAGQGLTWGSSPTGVLSLGKAFAIYGTTTDNDTVPSSGPYTITLSGNVTADLGVTVAGAPLTLVTGTPGPGQYKTNLPDPGTTYTFNAAQAGASVAITYTVLEGPTSYSLAMPNQLLYSPAAAAGLILTADFDFYFVCRFLDDVQEFENFMSKLWQLSKCQFVAIPPP